MSTTSEPSRTRQGNEGKPASKDRPPELDFSEVVKNRTRAPCSLNDFMDYLVYVEHNAENLQFFLWYCDYVQRWSKILPRQKLLSPEWNPEGAMATKFPAPVAAHKKAKSVKLTNILAILEMDSARNEALHEGDTSDTDRDVDAGLESPSPISTSSRTAEWQPYTIQPFRDEITRMARHYIAESSPRQLKLSTKDRNACLQALQHTTHPSALLPAFTMVEAILRDFSYPSFVAWSVSNCNRPRIVFLRVLATAVTALGFGLDVFLTLSRLSQYYRILSILLWWPGATALLAAWRGLSLLLHFRACRELRPWEQFEDAAGAEDDVHGDGDVDLDDYDSASAISAFDGVGDLEMGKHKHKHKHSRSGSHSKKSSHKHKHSHHSTSDWWGHSRKNTSTSTSTSTSTTTTAFRGFDPLRKPSMQSLGPSNKFDSEAWVGRYRRKSVFRKICEASVPTRNRDLQLMQDRIVLQAVIFGGLASAVLTIISLFLPHGNLYL